MTATPVAIALGSNLGDRRASIASAIEALRHVPGSTVLAVSSVIETAAVPTAPGVDPGGAYLNACATLRTTLGPAELLAHLHAIERRLGRDRSTQPHGAARTIDLDLLLYGERIIDEPSLVVPHPRLHERVFVLEPLAQIAGEWRIPGAGGRGRTVRQAMAHLLAVVPRIAGRRVHT